MDANDLEYVKNKLDNISKAQSDLTGQVNEIHMELTKIKNTLIGDRDYGQEGIVVTVAKHSKYIENDKLRNSKIIGGLAVIGFIWTFLLKYFLGK